MSQLLLCKDNQLFFSHYPSIGLPVSFFFSLLFCLSAFILYFLGDLSLLFSLSFLLIPFSISLTHTLDLSTSFLFYKHSTLSFPFLLFVFTYLPWATDVIVLVWWTLCKDNEVLEEKRCENLINCVVSWVQFGNKSTKNYFIAIKELWEFFDLKKETNTIYRNKYEKSF